MPQFYKKILDNNRHWVESKLKEDASYFERLATGQKPPLLWIGCADSRVPANEITGTLPGEVFVHRNIGNMVVHSDMNMLSVLDYAVNILEVSHVIVCGHYQCGGVLAAMDNKQHGLVDNWIRHIKDVYRLHKNELNSIDDFELRADRFVELNVIEQVYDLGKTSIVQNAWTKRGGPILHGWVYDIHNGLVRDLEVNIKNNTELLDIYYINPGDIDFV